MKKSLLNEKIHVIEGNAKLVGSDDNSFLIFNLPVKVTCPHRTSLCEFICYASQEERYPSVRKSRIENLEESKKDTFVADMIDKITYQLNRRKKYQGKHIYFRIHSAGDFYNQEYFDKWVAIAEHFRWNDRITFQAYTKSLPYVLKYNLNNINITLVYSVMQDSKREDVELAQSIGMKTFNAVSVRDFDDVPQESKCSGECGKCNKCYHYDNGVNDIYIAYHGSKAKAKRITEAS